jgi:RNA polymerase sigma-70 factor (ECF subfamily)
MVAAVEVTRVGAAERRAVFEVVYAANYPLILAYALRRTPTPDDAADVVAETFLTAWRRFEDVPAGSEARLWLYGVARLVLANHQRGRRRRERLGERLQSAAGPAEEVLPADGGAPGAVSAAFARLRPDDREILTLVAVEGLAPAEIARVLDCSGVAVRVRLHRARSRFARELAAAGVTV